MLWVPQWPSQSYPNSTQTKKALCAADKDARAFLYEIPVICRQPADCMIFDQTNTLCVTATGLNNTYQWYEGDPGDISNPISGATDPSIQLVPTAAPPFALKVWVRITSDCGSIDSEVSTAAASCP